MLQKLHHIKTFVFDVDGVLTNGMVLVNEGGEQLRQFNIKDGYALQLAVKKGYNVVAISGGKSLGVEKRLKGLGLKSIFLGVSNKVEVFNKVLEEYKLNKDHVVYIGDDIPDLKVMSLCGLKVCPADAVDEIKEIADYISSKKGGEGVGRDIIEKVLKIQNNWFDNVADASDGTYVK